MWTPWNKLSNMELIRQLSTVPATTPDLSLLKNRPYHLIFDYGLPIRKLVPITDAFTVEKLTMWNKTQNGDGVSAVVMKRDSIPRAKIRGKLYVATTEQLQKLDMHKQNGVLFKRKRVDLYTPFKNEDGKTAVNQAWMYTGIRNYWDEPIDWDTSFYRGHGDFQIAKIFEEPKELQHLRIGRYYSYSIPEKPPFKMSLSSHIRTSEQHTDILNRDQRAREDAEREARLHPPTEPQPRRFIHINSDVKQDSSS